MYNEIIRAFVIGSCFFVIIPFYYLVYHFDSNSSNINFMNYIFYAPLGLGLFNVLSLIIAKKLKLTSRLRFFIISLITPSIVTAIILYFKTYNYTLFEWYFHIFNLYLFYFFIFNVIVYFLDKHV